MSYNIQVKPDLTYLVHNTGNTKASELTHIASLFSKAPSLLKSLKFMVDAAKTEPGMDIYKAHVEQAEKLIESI